jgi:ketosteroid isomerase-like protein
MSTEENKDIVRRFFEVGPSKGDLSKANKLLAPDFTLHVPLPCSPGVKGINEALPDIRAWMPGRWILQPGIKIEKR